MGNENSGALMYETVLGDKKHFYAEILEPSTLVMIVFDYRYEFKPIYGCCNFLVVI